MRSSSYLSLSLATAMFLLLAMASMEVEAIRLDAETRASVSSSNGNQMPVNKPNETVVKGPASSISETKRSVHVGENKVRTVAHKLPEFHEDYYGATDHSPRHH